MCATCFALHILRDLIILHSDNYYSSLATWTKTEIKSSYRYDISSKGFITEKAIVHHLMDNQDFYTNMSAIKPVLKETRNKWKIKESLCNTKSSTIDWRRGYAQWKGIVLTARSDGKKKWKSYNESRLGRHLKLKPNEHTQLRTAPFPGSFSLHSSIKHN